MAAKIKKILVTGGSGFIGKHLIKALGERGANYDIKTTDQEIMDILDYDMLEGIVEALEPSAIIHLAAVSSLQDTQKNPELALRTNIIGTFNVLRAAAKHKVRVVLASSAATEDPKSSLYGASKRCMEIIASLFDNVVVAILYNVYGSGSKSVVNKFVKAIKSEKEIVLNGNTVRDYIYVDDVVKGLIALADAASPPQTIMMGTSRGVTLKKLVSIIQGIVGRKAKVIYGNEVKEIQVSQAGEPCSYYKTTLEQGIKRLL